MTAGKAEQETLPLHPLGVDREPGDLERLQVPVDRPGVAVQLPGQVGRGLSHSGRNQGLDDPRLPSELIASGHSDTSLTDDN